MSLEFIKHQPVVFYSEDENPEDEPGRGDMEYQNLVDATDKTYLQVRIAPIAGASNLITDSAFTTSTYWSTSGSGNVTTGLATIGDGSSGAIYRGLEGGLINDKLYQVQITVLTMFGTANVYCGSDLIDSIQSTGTHKLSFVAANDDIWIKIEDDTSYIEIINVSIRRLPENYALAILNTNEVPVNIISYLSDPDFFTIKKDSLTICVDWDALNIISGCYYLAISDPETNTCQQFGLYNYDFTIDNTDESGTPDIQGWNGNDNTNVLFKPSVHRVEITAPTTTTKSITNTFGKLCANKDYQIVVSAGTSDTDVPLKLSCGGNTETQLINGGTATDYTFTITPGALDYLTLALDNQTSPAPGPLTLTIYSVSVILHDITDWTFEYITPDQYRIADILTQSPNKTKLVQLLNNDDGLGFVWQGSNFFPTIRVESKRLNRKYDYQKEINFNDRGLKEVAFGEVRTMTYFRIEHLPNYILDFLALVPIIDKFYINEVEWYVESESYEPNYDDSLDNFGSAEFIISKPEQLVRNILSGQTNAPPSVELLLTDDRGMIITEPSTQNQIQLTK